MIRTMTRLCRIVIIAGFALLAVSCIKREPYRILSVEFVNNTKEAVYIEADFPKGLSDRWFIGSEEEPSSIPAQGTVPADGRILLYREASHEDIDAVDYFLSIIPDGTVKVYQRNVMSSNGLKDDYLLAIIPLTIDNLSFVSDFEVDGTKLYNLYLRWS